MSLRGPGLGIAGLAAILAVAVFSGGVVGVGPLAATMPPDRVTDPAELIARSLQATLDASSVHLDATLSGTIPGALVNQPERALALDGTTVEADLRPRDARTRAHLASQPLGADLETITVWADAWYRMGSTGPWVKVSGGDASAGAGIDVNPLTLVDRLRSYLARPDLHPTVTQVACRSVSGRCRRVVLEAGKDPATLLAALLPEERRAALPPVTTTLTLDTDATTLRPASLRIDVASEDGTVDLHLVVDASEWDGPSVIEEPPTGS